VREKQFVITDRVHLSPAEFEQLPIGDPRKLGFPYTPKRLQLEIDGRRPWHQVERQIQFGQSVYFARPIVIVYQWEEGTI
jgi:hypothetical protein